MGTTAEKLQYTLDGVSGGWEAVTEKGGTVPAVKDIAQLGEAVRSIPSGGGDKGPHNVRFIDIDGTILQSEYYKNGESATPPTPPTREYLTFTGWNYTPEEYSNLQYRESKRFFDFPGHLDIGATYKTTDDCTHFDVSINDANSKTLIVSITKPIGMADNIWFNIDWGDGSPVLRYQLATTGTTRSYTYPLSGEYHGRIWTDDNQPYGLGNNTTSTQVFTTGSLLIKKIYFSDYCYIRGYACSGMRSLIEVSLPPAENILPNATGLFLNCSDISTVIIPRGYENQGTSMIEGTLDLQYVSFPTTLKILGNRGCYLTPALTRLVLSRDIHMLPDNFTDGGSTVELISDTISEVGVNAFNSCYLMELINLDFSLKGAGTNMFNNGYSIMHIRDLEINAQAGTVVTAVVSWFFHLTGRLKIYSDTGTLTALGATTNFNGVERLVIGDNFTNITGAITTVSCKEYVFEGAVPPTLAAATNLNALNKLAKIYVPDESVGAYKTANFWSTLAEYIFPMSSLPPMEINIKTYLQEVI